MAVFYRYDYIEITNNIHPWHQDSRRFQPCHDDVFEYLLGVLILLFRVWPRAATRSHIWRIKRKKGDIDLVVYAVQCSSLEQVWRTATFECYRDWELKQEWAMSRENRNASRSQIVNGCTAYDILPPQEQVRFHLSFLHPPLYQVLFLTG